MYDYIRLETKSLAYRQKLLSLPLLKNKISGFNHDTWEISGKIGVRFQSLTIELFTSGRIVIYGSLHKYMNNGEHNYNDFNYKALGAVIKDLAAQFGQEVLDMTVTALEFGINIHIPFSPRRFTERCITFGNKERSPIVKDDRKGFDKGIAFNFTDYRLKIYNKSLQYNQPVNILRVEMKYLRRRIFQKTEINSLIDLLNPYAIEVLSEDLYNKVGLIVYKEDVRQIGLTAHQQRIYLESINTLAWVSWGKQKRNRRSVEYARLLRHHATSSDKVNILNLMIQKYISLMEQVE